MLVYYSLVTMARQNRDSVACRESKGCDQVMVSEGGVLGRGLEVHASLSEKWAPGMSRLTLQLSRAR